MSPQLLGVLLSLFKVLGSCVPTCQVRASVESVLLQTNARRLDAERAQGSGSKVLEAVYDFWDDVNKQHTFHFPPAWSHGRSVEMQGRSQFYVWRTQQPGTSPVYDWWDDVSKQHTFHMAPAWTHGSSVEHQGQVQFYAYEERIPGTEPIYAFWDDVNKQHTFHFGPEWRHGEVAELKGSFVFYAHTDARDAAPGRGKKAELKPVFDFWDDGNKQHTFHMLPPWGHGDSFEQQGVVQFLAYDGPFEGTEAVYDFWDTVNEQHTFHFPPAWPNEITKEVQFYAFRDESVPDLVAIHDFWDDVNQQHTFHTSPEWPNEKQGDLQFFAFGFVDETPTTTYEPTLAPTLEPSPMPTVVPSHIQDPSCHTCVEGDLCFRDVRWAMNHGVRLHPEWYTELGDAACFEQIQTFLHRRQHEDELLWHGMVHFPSGRGPVPFPCEVDGPDHMLYGLLYCR